MEYVYGALLLNAAGKPIDEKCLSGVLTAAGLAPDAARVKALIASLEGVNSTDVLAKAETFAAPAAAAAAAGKEGRQGREEGRGKEGREGRHRGRGGRGPLRALRVKFPPPRAHGLRRAAGWLGREAPLPPSVEPCRRGTTAAS